MFSRGNATSGAPIWIGMSALAKPANSGVANSSSMIVPCMVNSWLYWSGLSTTCRPGSISSARISRASSPPIMKKMNEVMKYRLPMILWSVVVTHFTTVWPGDSLREVLVSRRRVVGSVVRIAISCYSLLLQRWARTAAAASRSAPG